MSEEKAPRKPVPFYAWGEKQGPRRRTVDEEQQKTPEEKTAPLASLASAEDAIFLAGVEDPPTKAEALSYVRSFIQTNPQDMAQKMRFVEQVDIVCEAESIDGFAFFPSDLLLQVVQVLIRWMSSGNNFERKTAAEMLARICGAVRVRCGYQATAEFPPMGELVGCLALGFFDESAMVAHWAGEGLCHLYGFAAQCKGHSTEEQEILAQLMEGWSDGEEDVSEGKDPLEKTSIIPKLFKGVLNQEELAGVYLAVLQGIPENNAYSTNAAVYLGRVLCLDPTVALGKAPEIMRFLHSHLDFIENRHAWRHLSCILQLFQERCLSEVADCLLSCSPQCDSSAATLWRMLADRAIYVDEVLQHLMARLQGQQWERHLSAEEIPPLRLAAAHVIPALIVQPPLTLRHALGDWWVEVGLTWIFWMSRLHHGIQEVTRSHVPESATPASERLARSAAGTLQRLLELVWPDLLPTVTKDIWESLGSADSFHRGVSLLLGAINHRISAQELQQMVDCVKAFLRNHEEHQQVTAMTILAELLHTSDSIVTEETLHDLVERLASPNTALHSLALDGLLIVADKPKKVKQLLPLLPEAAHRLQESDHQKAQKLFGRLHRSLAPIACPQAAAEVAGQMLPLMEAENHVARCFAFTTFGAMLERGATRELKDLALNSLVSLLLHLHDNNIDVIEACFDTLPRVAILLGHQKLLRLFRNRDPWPICLVIAKRFRKAAKCTFLQQILEHLSNPQVTIRETAIRILGLVGQETKDRRKLEVIYKALRDLPPDEQPSLHSLAFQTIDLLEALHEKVPPRWTLREWLRGTFRACC